MKACYGNVDALTLHTYVDTKPERRIENVNFLSGSLKWKHRKTNLTKVVCGNMSKASALYMDCPWPYRDHPFIICARKEEKKENINRMHDLVVKQAEIIESRRNTLSAGPRGIKPFAKKEEVAVHLYENLSDNCKRQVHELYCFGRFDVPLEQVWFYPFNRKNARERLKLGTFKECVTYVNINTNGWNQTLGETNLVGYVYLHTCPMTVFGKRACSGTAENPCGDFSASIMIISGEHRIAALGEKIREKIEKGEDDLGIEGLRRNRSVKIELYGMPPLEEIVDDSIADRNLSNTVAGKGVEYSIFDLISSIGDNIERSVKNGLLDKAEIQESKLTVADLSSGSALQKWTYRCKHEKFSCARAKQTLERAFLGAYGDCLRKTWGQLSPLSVLESVLDLLAMLHKIQSPHNLLWYLSVLGRLMCSDESLAAVNKLEALVRLLSIETDTSRSTPTIIHHINRYVTISEI